MPKTLNCLFCAAGLLGAADAPLKTWPVQTRAMIGQKAPQDASTLPKSSASFSKPVAQAPYSGPPLVSRGPREWSIKGGWKLIAAPELREDGAQVSQIGFVTAGWIDATVPGTVLTTYIDRGVYPDPAYGLNNLAIPETLNKQDYWYRNEFVVDRSVAGKQLTLTFEGINYAAAVWLNGKALGEVKGAFIRGIFDVSGAILTGKRNVLAVRISPPPHPGIAHEQSIKAGPGENGGMECLDGPTFVATEGWDWIPSVRDRNTGIWQDVMLKATDQISIGDVQVITNLSLPEVSRADVIVRVPLQNHSGGAISGALQVSFEGVAVSRQVTLPPGDTSVQLTPAEFSQLSVAHPRLWWPNGYGSPELYHLRVQFGNSDQRQLRFGIRKITYELSLLDSKNVLQRVEISPTDAPGQSLVNVFHEGTFQTGLGWVASLRPDIHSLAAVRHVDDDRAAPFLILKVNGVKIACKGGSWGMDDFRKRVLRERLEPYFRLHRDAHLTMIRNWVGQSTEETFYDLADEYGLLVWNDFWESTQNYNLEPSDTALFLANARDTVTRFRNHPSIAVWCGRNEGVPSPAVNEGLDQLIRGVDGTRYYSPSSNQINLQNSGPYLYHDPADYFTTLDRGFAVEVGIPSIPTLETMKSFLPASDQWPISDAWAYHDWHQSGNGDTAPFMAALAAQFGPAESLDDFEKKAQLMNYNSHRAIFEGMNAHLWAPNSGRMLWMTQPAWPSTMWQILSSDYDTQASFFGVMKACEPVHAQMNLPDHAVAIVNNTEAALTDLTVRARVFGIDGKELGTREQHAQVAANAEAVVFTLDNPAMTGPDPVFVKLQLTDVKGSILSENFYWSSTEAEGMRKLTKMNPAVVHGAVVAARDGDTARVTVTLSNTGAGVALMNKLTLLHTSDDTRVLPAYFSDNYVSLLPGETRKITIEAPMKTTTDGWKVALRGWNAQPAVFVVQ